jgi:hypothetical protein
MIYGVQPHFDEAQKEMLTATTKESTLLNNVKLTYINLILTRIKNEE